MLKSLSTGADDAGHKRLEESKMNDGYFSVSA